MKLAGKTLLCTLVLIIASIVGGAIVSSLPLKPPALPGAASPGTAVAWMALASLVLVVGMVPIASGLGGRFSVRCLALIGLLYVANAVNGAIELSIFSTMGGERFLLVHFLVCFVATGAALAWLFGSPERVPTMPRVVVPSWAWRVVVAWLAFPIIYLVFGMCVAPFVVGHYQAGELGLRLPPMAVILRTQLLRSLLFLACSLPVIRLWTGSRWRLIFALGMAHAVMVGLYGLSQAYFMPSVLRVAHSLEIIADSFAYAFVLGWLFFPVTRTAAARETPVPISSTPTAA